MIKLIIICAIWFFFGIYTGIKIYNALSIVHIKIDDGEITDEEIDRAVAIIKERVYGQENE